MTYSREEQIEILAKAAEVIQAHVDRLAQRRMPHSKQAKAASELLAKYKFTLVQLQKLTQYLD